MTTHTLGSIEIPNDVWWIDEFDWEPVEQAAERSLTGKLIVHLGVKQGGRPITLQSNERGGWVPRSTVLALQAQRATPGTQLELVLADGREFTVQHDPSRAFEAAPVRPAHDMTGDTPYRITLPLIHMPAVEE